MYLDTVIDRITSKRNVNFASSKVKPKKTNKQNKKNTNFWIVRCSLFVALF